ncbi:MAG: PAS domain S-box protein [Candidatus Sulfotelmatobacter sp.]
MTNTVPKHGDSMDLQNVIETIPALVVCALADGTVEFVNRGWQEYTGYSPQKLNDSGWRSILHPDDLAKFVDEWNIALSAGRSFETEARIQRSDGQYGWFLIKKALAVSGTRNSKPSLRTLIAFEDIGARKQSQIELQQSEARYRLLIETASDAVISVDESGTITFANPSTMRIFGHAPNDLIGKALTVLMPEFLRPAYAEGLRRYSATGERRLNWRGLELVGLRKDGQEFPISVSLGELSTDGHRVFTAFIRDITEQKRAEESLRRTHSYLAQAEGLARIGTFAWEVPGRKALYLSDEWYRVYGFDPEYGAPTWEQLLERIHPEDRSRLQATSNRAIAEKSNYDIEFRILIPRAPIKFLHAVGEPVLSPAGELLQFVGVVMDITESRRAEEERERLRRAQADLAHINRVSTMGALTASLAHEIKQPIGAAVTNAEACLRLLDRDHPDILEAQEAAFEMVKDARRAADIIDRVRLLYQKGSTQPHEVDVNEVIGEMVVMLQNEANRKSIVIRAHLAQELPKVTADRVQLQQVLMNLMLNGIEAMQGTSGELGIRSQADGGKLLISITDIGMGLPAENAEQIFDPFFTTKPQGTGLGLAITRSIVEAHGGHIWASSNSRQGATFHFTLPLEPQ